MDKNDKDKPRGWHSRGYLPHFDGGGIYQFITYHLCDALPQKVINRWKFEFEQEKNLKAQIELYRKIEDYADQGYGECLLKNEAAAAQAQESLLRFDAVRYKLTAWVIMPNHIHFLIKPINNHSLSEIMQKYKSFTSHEINKILSRSGQFWQEDYFDRYIRDFDHYQDTVSYIENNPVKAGLCQKASDWKYSSAYRRSADGSSAND